MSDIRPQSDRRTCIIPKRVPSGINSLDAVIEGGFPAGSLVLLLGELGAGNIEFVYTSAAGLLSKSMTESEKSSNVSGQLDNICHISKICYISFSKSKEDIMNELALSFPQYYNILRDHIMFMDFSSAYFARSSVPLSWVTEDAISRTCLEQTGGANLIETVIEYLNKYADNSLVIIDSLTALAQYCLEYLEWRDLIMFLRGLQRISKRWNGLIYAVLEEGIFYKHKQEEVAECADGVIVFEWGKLGATQRQRFMHIKKFRGVLPLLDQENIVNFEAQITTQSGFEISNVKRVLGR